MAVSTNAIASNKLVTLYDFVVFISMYWRYSDIVGIGMQAK